MYDAIAHVYDKLNKDIDYSAWADFIEKCFSKYLNKTPTLVLDLACGTGSMTVELAERGHDMIGVDLSEDMLSEAYLRSEGKGILYLCQDMRSFELYGTVGAVVCCLDSLNYLLTEDDLSRAFATVHNYLDPDGLFIFDMNTPYKFENVYADNAYILEDEIDYGDGEPPATVFCGWQNEYDRESGICNFYLTLFEEGLDGKYARSEENQRERCYSLDTVKALLGKNSLEFIGCFSDFEFNPPADNCERWYIVARAKK
ncbi:MAG: class I SAM-dependent methyltransferase [Clostridia bacterium]|nr:class I SAM-dependent methyltransferase [Clostridia bacterium]